MRETFFLALPVPDTTAALFPPVLDHFVSVLKTPTPSEKLHLTLLWLGDASTVPPYMVKKVLKPLPQSFVVTARLTHVGRGRSRGQLWAFGEAAGPLVSVRQQLIERLKTIRWRLPEGEPKDPFVPHITLGTLYDQVSRLGIADYPLITSYPADTIILYKSRQDGQNSVYSKEGLISLT